jgi:hypothetical protein
MLPIYLTVCNQPTSGKFQTVSFFKGEGMKKIIFATVLFIAVGFSTNHYTSDKATATVNQVQGVYIFIDSKPVAEYTYLGTVDTKGIATDNPQYTIIRDKLIGRIKKDWPAADGVIFSFNAGGRDHADAIKFK